MCLVVFLVRFFNKKGLANQALVVILVAAVFFLLSSQLPAQIGKVAEPVVRDDVCRASVETKTKFKTDTFGSPLELNCVEEEIVSRAKTKEQVNLELATEMYRCWYKFGEGEKDWYSGWDLGKTDLHCKICSRITYPKLKESPTFGEFNQYLNNKKLTGKDETFSDFFTGNENSLLQFGGPGIKPEDEMDLSKSLYVVYTIAKFDENRINDLRELSSQYEGNIAYGIGSTTDEIGGSIDGGVATGLGVSAAGATALFLVGSNPIGWTILLAGAGYTLFSEVDADVPYYSLALFSAEDISGMCDDLG